MATISFVSLGCDKNLVDSEVMIGILKENGHVIIEDESESDIIVINTCSFIEDALTESIDCIIEAGNNKQNNALKGIIVAGCLPQRYGEAVFEQLPEVDVILGTTSYQDIAGAVEMVLKGSKKSYMNDIDLVIDDEVHHKRELSVVGSHFAYLKIAEGCDNHCTYCIIPKLRGKYRSRTIDSLLKEANKLADRGVKELILVAQDTSVYGKDIYGEIRLHQLIERLSQIEGIKWIRLLYCYPENITDELILQFKNNDKLCNYIDMPIQHVSDSILKLMGRKTSYNQIVDKINRLRVAVPDIAIRTSIIAGFPGETEEDFNKLQEFVKEIKLDRLGVFAFSKEEGTPSYNMKNQIPQKIKNSRKNRLMKIQKNIADEIGEKMVSKRMKVIVEGRLPEEDLYVCRSYRDTPEVDSYVFVSGEGSFVAGDFLDVVITKQFEYDLMAEILLEND